MDIRIGKTVRRLRQEKGITQEELGNCLGISYQAVSKWESGATLPDIALLPELAAFFGITIDDLFSIKLEDHLARIDHMFEHDFRISTENLAYAKQILEQAISENPDDPELHSRLAGITAGNWARDLRDSISHIERAIALAPFEHKYHFMLQDARKRLLEPERLTLYYKRFIERYPDWAQGYAYLAITYLEDKKPKRALAALERGTSACPGDLYLRYLVGDVKIALGDEDGALAIWTGIMNEASNDWKFVNRTADRLAELERFEEAFKLWERAFELDPENGSPLYSAAFAYDTVGRYDKAIEQWERIITLSRDVYGITDGEGVDWPLREIERLKAKASGVQTAY